jgi:hypothetical protein
MGGVQCRRISREDEETQSDFFSEGYNNVLLRSSSSGENDENGCGVSTCKYIHPYSGFYLQEIN